MRGGTESIFPSYSQLVICLLPSLLLHKFIADEWTRAGCKLAVISRTQADGSQGWGMLWYRTLAAALADINLACVYGSTGGMRGGYKRTGKRAISYPFLIHELTQVKTDTESNLVVVLYQLSSDYDRFVKAELAAGRLPVADGDGSPFKTSKPPVQNSPEGPLDDTATSAFREPNAQQVTGQICDQYCSSVNLCTGGDGCRCIADPWQYPGSGYFTGTCKLPYFDSGRRLSEFYVNSTSLVNITRPFSSASVEPPVVKAPNLSGSNDTGLACPCNCTYVSKACCFSKSGMVHEAPSLKLGALQPPKSLMVCNPTNGQFQLVA